MHMHGAYNRLVVFHDELTHVQRANGMNATCYNGRPYAKRATENFERRGTLSGITGGVSIPRVYACTRVRVCARASARVARNENRGPA